MPELLYRTQEQKERYRKIGQQKEELAHKISEDATLMNKAKELGLEKFIRVEASSYYLKEKDAREKALGLDQGMGYEMAIIRDEPLMTIKKPNNN